MLFRSYAHVAALQVAAMRDAVAEAAKNEAALARRFHEAGNMSRLQSDLEQAASERAVIDALRARSEASDSKASLASLLGLEAQGVWRTVDRLPAPPDASLSRDDVVKLALSGRLDLAAAREEVAMLEDALHVTSRWRMLGSVDAGYKKERESDGSQLRGPTLDLELPLFNQWQGAVARAEARLLNARARRDALTLAVENEVTSGIGRLEYAREITERYRTSLLPHMASAVARRQEEVNFMLKGVFELISVKREEYDAWQAYLESMRDYWIARTALRAAVGSNLPGDEVAQSLTVGADDIVAPANDGGAMNQSPHEHHGDKP